MGNSTNAIFKKVIGYFSVNVVVSAIAFSSVIIYSHLLSPQELGLYGEFYALVPVLTIIISANLSHSVLFFYKKENRNFKNYMMSMITFQFFSYFCVVVLIVFSYELEYIQRTEFRYYLFASFLALVFSARLLCEKLYVARGKVKSYAKLNVFYTVALTFFGLIFVYIYPNHWTRIQIEMALAVSLSIYLFIFFVRVLDFKINVNFHLVFNALKFSVPRIPFSLSIAIMPLIDRHMISLYYGYSELGTYVLATSYSSVMLVAISAITPAFLPSYYDLMEKKRYEKIDLINKKLSVLIAIGYLILSLFINDFAGLVSGNDYVLPVFLIPIILTSYLWHSLSSMYCRVFDYKKQTFYLSIVAFTSMVLNVLFNFLLIPKLGILGASIATLLAYFSMAIFSYYISRFVVDVHTSPILGLFSGYIFASFLVFLLLMESVYIRFGVLCAILGVAYVLRKRIFIASGKSN